MSFRLDDGNVHRFRFWCQKVLPLVYDNSLSYYEVLCKVVDYLNHVIEDVNTIPDYIDSVIMEMLNDEHLVELIAGLMRSLEDAISANNEGTNTNSEHDYSVGDLLWLNNVLYEAIRDIDAGDTLIVDTNISAIDFETLYENFIKKVKDSITSNDDGKRITSSANRIIGEWVWLDDVLYIVCKNIDEGDAYVYTGTNANVKTTTVETESEMIYYANDKKLSIHAKIDDYSEIVTSGDYHVYTPRIKAIEIKKVE